MIELHEQITDTYRALQDEPHLRWLRCIQTRKLKSELFLPAGVWALIKFQRGISSFPEEGSHGHRTALASNPHSGAQKALRYFYVVQRRPKRVLAQLQLVLGACIVLS